MSAKASSPSRVMKETSAPSRRRRDRLVRALAARSEHEGIAQDRLAHARLALGAIGGVGDEDAEDDDFAGLAMRCHS